MKTVNIDPSPGVDVDESSEPRAEHEGSTYLFYSEKCRQRFLRDPTEFAYDGSTD
jgi:YHS domain-containing protein